MDKMKKSTVFLQYTLQLTQSTYSTNHQHFQREETFTYFCTLAKKTMTNFKYALQKKFRPTKDAIYNLNTFIRKNEQSLP
uniref:Uncharacterized protein n=1 Tax=Romanomermis culicivorax TaxID=13658 RepID=A0A915JEP2_ROMCU